MKGSGGDDRGDSKQGNLKHPADRFLDCSRIIIKVLRRIQDLRADRKRAKTFDAQKNSCTAQQASWCNAVCVRRAAELLAARARSEDPTDHIQAYKITANVMLGAASVMDDIQSVYNQCAKYTTKYLRWLLRSHEYPLRYLMEHFARKIARPRAVLEARRLKARRDDSGSVGFRIDKKNLRIVDAAAQSGALPGMRITHVDGNTIMSWSDYCRYALEKKSFTLLVLHSRPLEPSVDDCTEAARKLRSFVALLRAIVLEWHSGVQGNLKQLFARTSQACVARECDRRITAAAASLYYRSRAKADAKLAERVRILTERIQTPARRSEDPKLSEMTTAAPATSPTAAAGQTTASDGPKARVSPLRNCARSPPSQWAAAPTATPAPKGLTAAGSTAGRDAETVDAPPISRASSTTSSLIGNTAVPMTSDPVLSLPEGFGRIVSDPPSLRSTPPTFFSQPPTPTNSMPIPPTPSNSIPPPVNTPIASPAVSQRRDASGILAEAPLSGLSLGKIPKSISGAAPATRTLVDGVLDSTLARDINTAAGPAGTGASAAASPDPVSAPLGKSLPALSSLEKTAKEASAPRRRRLARPPRPPATEPRSPRSPGPRGDIYEGVAREFAKRLLRDRKYRFRRYPNCLVAREAVAYLVSNGYAKTPTDAVRFGEKMRRRGLLVHVMDSDKIFKDGYYFFKVILPEGPGTPPRRRLAERAWSAAALGGIVDGAGSGGRDKRRNSRGRRTIDGIMASAAASRSGSRRGSATLRFSSAYDGPSAIRGTPFSHGVGALDWSRLEALSGPRIDRAPGTDNADVPPQGKIASAASPVAATPAALSTNNGEDQEVAQSVGSGGPLTPSERSTLAQRLKLVSKAYNRVVRLLTGMAQRTTVESKVDVLNEVCAELPRSLGNAELSADDLLCALLVALVLVRPQHLTAEAALLRDLQPVVLHKSEMDARGFSITTFVCAVEYLQGITVKSFSEVVMTVFDKLQSGKGGSVERPKSPHGSSQRARTGSV